MSEELKRCTRCVLPETYPNIKFNKDGICNVCIEYDKIWKRWKESGYKKTKLKLEKITHNVKRLKRKYDCLVPFSGGKDSSYVLYLCKKVFGMNVLAVNFDNGFQTEEAIQNIRNAAEILGVDLIIYKPRWEITKKLTKHFLLNAGEACTPCNFGIVLTIFKIAKLERIPLILSGLSPRSDERSSVEIYSSGSEYFKKVIRQDAALKKEIKNTIFQEYTRHLSITFKFTRKLTRLVLLDKGIFRLLPKKFFTWGTIILELPEYIEWNEEQVFKVIREELKWKESKVGKEHTDCLINPVKCYLRYQRWGFGSKTQKLSALLRDGQMKREDAIELIKNEGNEPEELKYLMDRLNLDSSQLETIKKSYHMKYLK